MNSDWEIFNINRINASAGAADAQYYLGYSFLTGNNVAADKKKAERWLRLSAAQGFRQAQLTLAKNFFYNEAQLSELVADYRDRLNAVPRFTSAPSAEPASMVETTETSALRSEDGAADVAETVEESDENRFYDFYGEQDNENALDEIDFIEDGADNRRAGLTRDERIERALDLSSGKVRNYEMTFMLLEPLCENGDEIALKIAANVRRMQDLENGVDEESEDEADEDLESEEEFDEDLEEDEEEKKEKSHKFVFTCLKDVRKAAEEGNPDAQFLLGECYYYGRSVDCDYAEALIWYKKAAESGQAEASCQIGNCYILGQGVESDYDKAFHWFKTSALDGFSAALYNLALCYRNGWGVEANAERSQTFCQKAADAGNARAQYEMGKAAYDRRDMSVAVTYLTRADEQGAIEAKSLLATLYEKGEGVEQNTKKAFELLSEAAEDGDLKAQVNLARFYFEGVSVPKDQERAAAMARSAAEKGVVEAQMLMARYYKQKNSPSETFRWLRLAAEGHNARAAYELGNCYADGKGTPINESMAFQCFDSAAKLGSVEALPRLADCYKHGFGVAKNASESARLMKWYREYYEK